MDAVCSSLKGSYVPAEDDPCPICTVDFHGRDVLPEVVKARCGHRFDLECIARSFIFQSFGSRRCAMCRQDPMPLMNEDTGESYPDEFFPDQAFYNACTNGDLALVSFRLAQGGRVNGATADDFTALMLAAHKGRLDVARLLIEKGAKVDDVDADGWTALMLAVDNGQLKMVELLIEKGARVDGVADFGITSLMLAA